jgi:hypothetical protein
MNDILTEIGKNTLLVGLAAFLGKLWATSIAQREQSELDVELEQLKADLQKANQKLDARLQKSIHVHRVQFEKEFEIYLALSSSLVNLRNSFFSLNRNLRPIRDDPDERKKYWDEQAKDFIKSYTDFRDLVDNNKPFYCQTVFDAAQKLVDRSVDELIYRQFHGGEAAHPLKELKEIKKELLASVSEIIEAIRKRIASLEVED